MNLRIKIVLSIIVSLLLLISMAGFLPVFSQTPPNWVITGRIMAPSPETTKDIASWIPVTNAILTLTDFEGNSHVVTTSKDGYYFFNNLAVNANCVITAIAIVNGKTMVFKDVIPRPVAVYETYDAGTADAESTALALIVEELIEQGLTHEDINLEIIQDSENFKIVEEQVLSVLEDNGNVMDDIIVAGEAVASGEAFKGTGVNALDLEAIDEEGMAYRVTVAIRSPDTTAQTSRDTYTITAFFVGSGTIDPSGAVTVNHGSDQSFTITPDPNYHILGITVDGNLNVGPFGSPYTYPFTSVTDDHTIAAYFAINTFDLTMSAVSPDGGGITSPVAPGTYTYDAGTEVTISASANEGYRFVKWTGDVTDSGSAETSVTMNATKSVTANFEVCSEYDCYDVSYSYDSTDDKTTFEYAVWEKWIDDNKGSCCKDISNFKLNFGDISWNVSMTVDEGTDLYIKEVKENEIKMDDLKDGFKKGTITITFTGRVKAEETGVLTIKAGTGEFYFDVYKPIINDDATLSDLTVDGKTVTDFSSSTYTYNVELPYGTTLVPEVEATLNDFNASVTIDQAINLTGSEEQRTATVLVTAEDGTTQKTYTVVFAVGVLDHIVISPDYTTITAGETQTYTAEAFDVNDNTLGDVTAETSFVIQAGAGGSWADNTYTSETAGISWIVTGTYSEKFDTAALTVTMTKTITNSVILSYTEGDSISADHSTTVTY